MNKQRLNISERDRKLLTFLILILIAFLCYFFLLNPELEKSTRLKIQYNDIKIEYNRASTMADKLPEIRKEETNKKKELQEKYKQFFYEINEARILYKLNASMAEAGFPVDVIAFTRASAGEITMETADYQPLTYPLYVEASKTNPSLIIPKDNGSNSGQNANNNGNAVSKDAVAFTEVTLQFTSASYESIYNFLQKLEKLDRSIIVKGVTIDKNEIAAMKGQVVLEIYSLAKPNEADRTDQQFDNVLPKGKANPFL